MNIDKEPKFRNYRDGESPQIGDVVRLFDGAFGTCIVRDIIRIHGEPTVVLDRAHMKVSNGQLMIGIETVNLTERRFLKEVCVYVRGVLGQIDNRNRS